MVKICIKSLLYFTLVTTLLVCLERAYFHYTGAFSLNNIDYESTPFKPISLNQTLSPSEKVKLQRIIRQNFFFLGKGNQTYAFLSADGDYVLKFFKFGHIKNSWYQDLFRNGDVASRWKRFQQVFEGYQLAYTKNRENSGLIYIHLNKTTDLRLKVRVKDRLGISHKIDLDSVVFVLQEKAITAKELFISVLDEGEIQTAKVRLDQLLHLYLAEYQQGLYDRDHNLLYNTGFTKNGAVRFDVGKLRADDSFKDPSIYREDFLKIINSRLKPWFRKHYPSYAPELERLMDGHLNAIR